MHAPGFWRRSLQARLVITTLVLAAMAVTAVSWLLLQQVRSGLLEHRADAVVAEATAEVDDARSRLGAASAIDVDSYGQQRDLIEPIIQRGLSRGFDVVMTGPVDRAGTHIAAGGAQFTPGLDTASVPRRLEAHFVPGADTAWTYTTIHRGSRSTPGIVLGSEVTVPADGQTYVLYFLFPLDEEQKTLGLVSRALIVAATLLILFVVGAAWLVIRQVVTPIRLAREVAERLAAGMLQERLPVHGEDDLARLAVSFNQMAGALQSQIRQLEELSRVQRRFTSDVSHELRTPLTTVRMASDVLHDARDDFDPVSARAAELLQVELDRFESLLVDLLEISRIDAGAAVLETEDVDLAGIAQRAVEDTRVLAARRPVAVELRLPETPAFAEADGRRVARIVRNLVTNAIDHAGDGGRVVVTVAGDDHAAAVTVRDYGIGLAPGESAMVFNRFWRADPARDRSSGGTGLGLAISLEDAHLHGGWLQAWGRKGGGAQFRLTLPRHAGGPLHHSPLPLVPADAGEAAS